MIENWIKTGLKIPANSCKFLLEPRDNHLHVVRFGMRGGNSLCSDQHRAVGYPVLKAQEMSFTGA
jgi:hypothetical protein